MKSYDFNAVVIDGEIYCIECRPRDVRMDDPALSPIFAGSEWDYIPVCCECGYEHDYVIILESDDTCEQCKKLGENTCGNDMQCRCFEPKN